MKNKKSLTLSLICLAIIACFSTFLGTSVIFAADEYTYSCNINGVTANFTYNLNEENKIENLKCTNSSELTGNVTIPGLIEGKEVVTIGDNAFKGASNITGVVVPDSVKTIEYNAFTDCTNLKDVNLGKIESLSFAVFKNCTALTSIKIPNTLKQGAVSKIFTNCSNLTNITLEDGLTVIPSFLCAGTAITEITVPDSVKTIDYSAFEDCTNLKDVNLGKIESLSFDVFKNCTALTSIKIPNTLKQGAVSKIFTNCSNLTNITLEDGLTVIPSFLCAGTAITEITVPDSVKTIDYSAFEDCTNLKDVNLGKIESLSFDVFKNCTALTSIKIPNTLKQGAVSKIFTNCSNLTNITLEDGLTVIPSYLCADTAITEITIPDSVKTIEYSAFEDCTNLKKITILDNVDSIGFFGINEPKDSVFKNHDEDLTIYCYRDSIAAKYAIKYNIKYVYLDKPIIDDSKAEDNKDVNNNEQIIEDSNDNNEQVLDNSNINEQSNNPKTGDVTFYILGILILAVAGCTIVPMCLRKEIK